MIFAGIDPGKQGAIAILESDGRVRTILPVPLIQTTKTSRPEFDLPKIRDYLCVWRQDQVFVTLERLTALPPRVRRPDGSTVELGGGIANFNRGQTSGWEWMLTALDIPFSLVLPQRWQKTMLDGTPVHAGKARSILAVHRLFPGVCLTRTPRSRKESHDLADAVLIAEYGRRSGGSTVRPTESVLWDPRLSTFEYRKV